MKLKSMGKVIEASSSKKKNKQRLNWIKLAEKDRIPTNAKYLNPRITFDGLNWWISVVVEYHDIIEENSNDMFEFC